MAPGAFHPVSLSGFTLLGWSVIVEVITLLSSENPQKSTSTPSSVTTEHLPWGNTTGCPFRVALSGQSSRLMVPGFCCRVPGDSESANALGVGGHQERAVIGSSWFLLRLRRTPLGSSVSASLRCRNQCSPIRVVRLFLPYSTRGAWDTCSKATLVELAGVEPASSTHPLQLPGGSRPHTTIFTAGRRKPNVIVERHHRHIKQCYSNPSHKDLVVALTGAFTKKNHGADPQSGGGTQETVLIIGT